MTHSYVHVWHDSFICVRVTWLIHMCTCDMTHSYVYAWHDSFVCVRVTWLIHMSMRAKTWDTLHRTRRCAHPYPNSICTCDSFMCETWLIYMGDMTHSYVRHDPFVCATWLVRKTWLIRTCHDTFVGVCDLFMCVTRHISRCHMTCSCVWHDSFVFMCVICSCAWHDLFIGVA